MNDLLVCEDCHRPSIELWCSACAAVRVEALKKSETSVSVEIDGRFVRVEEETSKEFNLHLANPPCLGCGSPMTRHPRGVLQCRHCGYME